ncbi:hypothetical protein AGLY_004910 [Aphis glycines]|uniref:Uncharacterized protein n=1 Tax=Aphis glycines TaxID=307491 RepID=A0A6G0TV87_APHGL|nr:hypothetical protein AGLY_004910 [Aphis glycines]
MGFFKQVHDESFWESTVTTTWCTVSGTASSPLRSTQSKQSFEVSYHRMQLLASSHKWPPDIRSSRRPGVATIISTPEDRAAIWSLMLKPPTTKRSLTCGSSSLFSQFSGRIYFWSITLREFNAIASCFTYSNEYYSWIKCRGILNASPRYVPFLLNPIVQLSRSNQQPIVSCKPKLSP